MIMDNDEIDKIWVRIEELERLIEVERSKLVVWDIDE
jgi:tetrahydromethanopterin S-methyltransferase subunit G